MSLDSRAARTVQIGEELAAFEVLITLQKLVMEAGANRDFAQIHFERDAARATGAPDIYANTIFLEGVIEACLRRWAGSDAVIEEITFRMKSFNLVGDRIAAHGIVTEVDTATGRVTAEIWIQSPRGRTVEGQAVVGFDALD